MAIDATFSDTAASCFDPRDLHFALWLVIEAEGDALSTAAHNAPRISRIRHEKLVGRVVNHDDVCCASDGVKLQIIVVVTTRGRVSAGGVGGRTTLRLVLLLGHVRKDLHEGGLGGRVVTLRFGYLFKTATVQRIVDFEEALTKALLEIALLVLFNLEEQFFEVSLGVLSHLTTTMAIEHTEQVLLRLKLKVMNRCVLLFSKSEQRISKRMLRKCQTQLDYG